MNVNRRNSIDHSNHSARSSRVSRRRPSMDQSGHSTTARRRTSIDHSGHYNPARSGHRTSIDLRHAAHNNVMPPTASPSKVNSSTTSSKKSKYNRRRASILQTILGRNPLGRIWLCTCISVGVTICLGRSVRITLDIATNPKIDLDASFYNPASPLVLKSSWSQNLRVSDNSNDNPSKHLPSSFNFLFYNEEKLNHERQLYRQSDDSVFPAMQELLERADQALVVGPWSVTDKPSDSVAPSNNNHDYYHPAPYFWPHKNADDTVDYSLPYEYHDGERIPGTALYETGSENFDRSRLSSMQYNTTILGLAYFLTGNEDYASVAARNIRVWFVNNATKMNPHLLYAQVRRNHNKANTGSQSGIIELKDLYFFLDAVQMVLEYLEPYEEAELKQWFTSYLGYLEASEQGLAEKNTKNNHGLYFDIQEMAVANFLGEKKKLERIWRRAESRISEQIVSDAKNIHAAYLVEELKRSTCEHYQMFTLEGWWTMARIGENILKDQKLWLNNKNALCRASKYAVPYLKNRQPCKGNTQTENDQRWWPIMVHAIGHCSSLQQQETMTWRAWMSENSKDVPNNMYEMPRVYNPHDGIAPFWNLGFATSRSSNSNNDVRQTGAWRVSSPENKEAEGHETSGKIKSTNSIAKSTSTLKTSPSSPLLNNTITKSSKISSSNTKTGSSSTLFKTSNRGTSSDEHPKSSSFTSLRSSSVSFSSSFPKKKLSTREIFQNSKPSGSVVAGAGTTQVREDYIPSILIKAARTNPKYANILERLRRWHGLGQTKIVQKIIQKSLNELVANGYD